MILLGTRHIDNSLIPALPCRPAGPAGHHIRIHVDRIDRIGNGDDVVQTEDFLHIPAIALGAVADDNFVNVDVHAARLVVVVGDRLSEEFVSDPAVVIPLECLGAAHFLDRLFHRLDHRRCDWLRYITNPHTDNLRLRVSGLKRPSPPSDLRK